MSQSIIIELKIPIRTIQINFLQGWQPNEITVIKIFANNKCCFVSQSQEPAGLAGIKYSDNMIFLILWALKFVIIWIQFDVINYFSMTLYQNELKTLPMLSMEINRSVQIDKWLYLMMSGLKRPVQIINRIPMQHGLFT